MAINLFNISHSVKALKANIEQVIIGKGEVVAMAIVALLAKGHLLIEDVPGVGKTTLARSLAKSIDCSFQRIQFTPDLLPSDIVGVSIYNAASNKFEFKPGAIFANIILADEVNRASPRTQSSLLEAMNDFQVSVDGVSYKLPRPFMVLATQNPIEYEGTFPLPESQLDRFLMRIMIGYPSPDDEKKVLKSQSGQEIVDLLAPVLSVEQVVAMQDSTKRVRVDDSLVDYILEIVRRTRADRRLTVGVSPRGAIALYRGSQALALIEERDFCIPDDVKTLAISILAHRLIATGAPSDDGKKKAQDIIAEIIEEVAVPF